jgi:hypothetical protein
MHSGDESVRISKVEYLGDVITSAVAGAFNNVSFEFNPGIFLYWGSHFAALFQQWKLDGAMVYFKSRSSSYTATTTLGTVMICMDYNAHNDPFISKQAMQETAGCVACAIDHDCSCGIEANAQQTTIPVKFVRTKALPTGEDKHQYDLGKLQIATQGCPASVNIGEIYIAYDMTFFKPIIRTGLEVQGAHYYTTTGIDATHSCGTVTLTKAYDTLGVTIDQTTRKLTIRAGNAGNFKITFHATGSSIPAVGDWISAAETTSNLTTKPILRGAATVYKQQSPGSGAGASDFTVTWVYTITDPSSESYMIIPTAALPVTQVDIHVDEVAGDAV